MTARALVNIFLRLQMAGKEDGSDILFDSGREGESPFGITGIYLDEDGDICLESDARTSRALSAKEIAEAVRQYEEDRTVYFVSIDEKGEGELFNIKDGGTKDRHSKELRFILVHELVAFLSGQDPDGILHFESGTINFTVNSVYVDDEGCLCLESNEIMELDDYPVAMLLDELSSVSQDTKVVFYDDDSKEYYGIYPDEHRVDKAGDIWVNVR